MKKFRLSMMAAGIVSMALLFLAQAGCKKDESTANFSVNLKSSNALRSTYNAVNIDIQRVSIHLSANPDETSGWFDLPTNEGIYDLLDYENGNGVVIALEPYLEVQTVSQIRLILGDANTIIVDGTTYDLDTPSAQTSGLKIQVHADLQPDLTYLVVLDFDVNKSIVNTGNGKYKLTPVINATVVQPE